MANEIEGTNTTNRVAVAVDTVAKTVRPLLNRFVDAGMDLLGSFARRPSIPSGLSPVERRQADIQIQILEAGVVPSSVELVAAMRAGRPIPQADLAPLAQLVKDSPSFTTPAKEPGPTQPIHRVRFDRLMEIQNQMLDAGFFPRQKFPQSMADREANASAQIGNLVSKADFDDMAKRYQDYRALQSQAQQFADAQGLARASEIHEEDAQMNHALVIAERHHSAIAVSQEHEKLARERAEAAEAAARAAEAASLIEIESQRRIAAAKLAVEQGIPVDEAEQRIAAGRTPAPRELLDIQDTLHTKLGVELEQLAGPVAHSTIASTAAKLMIEHFNSLDRITDGTVLRSVQSAKVAIPAVVMALCVSLDYGFNAIGANAIGSASSMGNAVAIPLSFIAGLGGYAMSRTPSFFKSLVVGAPFLAVGAGVMYLGNGTNEGLITAGERMSNFYSPAVSDRDAALANLEASEGSTRAFDQAIAVAQEKWRVDQGELAKQKEGLALLRNPPAANGGSTVDAQLGAVKGKGALQAFGQIARNQAAAAGAALQAQRERLKFSREEIASAEKDITAIGVTIKADQDVIDGLQGRKNAELRKYADLESTYKDADSYARIVGNVTITGLFTIGILACSMLYSVSMRANSAQAERNRIARQTQKELRSTRKTLSRREGLEAVAENIIGKILSRLSTKEGVTLPEVNDQTVAKMVDRAVSLVAGARKLKHKEPKRPETIVTRIDPPAPTPTA